MSTEKRFRVYIARDSSVLCVGTASSFEHLERILFSDRVCERLHELIRLGPERDWEVGDSAVNDGVLLIRER